MTKDLAVDSAASVSGWARAHVALAAFALGAAWNMPLTAMSAALGWLGAYALVRGVLCGATYRHLFEAGIIAQLLGFHWLLDTIATFGGLPYSVAVALFVLFVLVSALQFPLFLWVYRHLPGGFHRFGLALPLAWVALELLSVRIFPWYWGHTQIASSALAQLAELGGAPLVSWVMFFVLTLLAQAELQRRVQPLLGAAIVLILSLVWGASRLAQAPIVKESKTVILVQGNLGIDVKGVRDKLSANLEHYTELTERADPMSGGLVIWPESVFASYMYENVGRREYDKRLTVLPQDVTLLFGALSARSEFDTANAAVLLHADGTIEQPYRKQILMPFGEYSPFADQFPLLNDLNPNAPNFVAGKGPAVFRVPSGLAVSPLICYEDVVPDLSVAAVGAGATVLANLTNDAWFGASVAPYQHHLIASFRAIETRRYLLRATNTGFTAVVDPFGVTVASLAPFTEGALTVDVEPRAEITPFVAAGGERPWRTGAWTLVIISLLVYGKRRFFRRS